MISLQYLLLYTHSGHNTYENYIMREEYIDGMKYYFYIYN
jgi:hypothetical protein